MTLKNIFRRENALPIVLVIAGLSLVGYNVATAVKPSNAIPDNILYTYLEKDVVTEKASDTATSSAGYKVIATLASAVTAAPAEAADVQDVMVTDQGDTTIAPTLTSQMLLKPRSTTTDGITRQRSEIILYEVQSGETLSQIAHKFNLKLSTVLWANGLTGDSIIRPGQTMTILPVDGVKHVVASGDTVASVSKKYNAKPELVSVFNSVEGGSLKVGATIVVPDGVIQEAPKPAPAPQAPVRTAQASKRVATASTIKIRYGTGGHRFPYGWCTYWAALKRGGLPFGGNAREWPANARAYGFATGKKAVAGAIYVEPWLSGYGHVSYVERVNGDGSFVISEMNYEAWGVVDYRTVPSAAGVFIY